MHASGSLCTKKNANALEDMTQKQQQQQIYLRGESVNKSTKR